MVFRDGDFLWPPTAPTIRPRDRSLLPDYSRRPEFVGDAELDAALIWALSQGKLDLSGDAREALATLGLGRPNPSAEGRVSARLQQLVQAGQLRLAAPDDLGPAERQRTTFPTREDRRRVHEEQLTLPRDAAAQPSTARSAPDASSAVLATPAADEDQWTAVPAEVASMIPQLADPQVRRSCQTKLRRLGKPAVVPLIAALADETLRPFAAVVLVELGQLAVPQLSAAMLHGDAGMRRAAEQTLDRMGL
jgi:hypothetical protein